MNTLEIKDKWTVIAPVGHVELTAAVNYEFRINRVRLVATDRLQGRRRRLGVPWRVSEMRSQKHGIFKRFLGEAPVVAIVRVSGTVNDLERTVATLLRNELAILGASQLGYAKRRSAAAPAILGEHAAMHHSLLWISSNGAWTQPNRTFGSFATLRLDEDWMQFQRQVFFNNLLRVLRREIRVGEEWRQDLERAAILVGLSHSANSVADAFLWNMIALELLLTKQEPAVGDALPSRAEALLGWSREWSEDGFREKIRGAYSRRCQLVHQGDRDSPSREDLYFTDDLLLCLLANLVTHPKIFFSKDAVIEFAKKIEAERLLRARPKVRPKSLRMFRREYRPRDYDIY